jgi:hypothetical protein
MKPRLAVVIPVYNHAHFIAEGLESVLGQSRPPDRVICIDDGSKDDSLAVMEPFKARGVEVSGRENRGAHETINELVARAAEDCQWISILNSDDRYLPHRFETCFRVAEQQPEKSIICTGLEVIDGDGQLMAEDSPRARWFYGVQSLGAEQALSAAEWMGRGNFVATTSNVFARAEYLLANPMRPYRYIHDYFFLAGAAFRDQIAFYPERHLQYRVHGSNTISTHPEPLIREMLRMHLDLLHHYADELREDACKRQRFYEYSQALWENMSSMHAGLFQVLLAQLAGRVSYDELEALANSIRGPEFEVAPNRTLAASFDGTAAISAAVLSRRLDELRLRHQQLQGEDKAWKSLARLRGQLMGSRWLALGQALGLAGKLRRNDGGTAEAKWQLLCAAVRGSSWLRLGARLGSGSCRDCLDSCGGAEDAV